MAVDWFADPLAWTGFLRAQGFSLGVGDELRVMLLLDELRGRCIPLPDVATAARWVAPVLCRNSDQQARLVTLLDGFVALVEPKLIPPVPPVTPEVAQALRSNRYWWWLVGVVLVCISIMATVAFWNGTGTPAFLAPTPPVTDAARPVADTAPALAHALAVLENVVLALIPLLLAIVLLAARHRRRAALSRGLAPREARQSGLGIRIIDVPLFRRAALQATFADLRRHRMVPGEGIDVPASIAATLAAAGFVMWVPAQRPSLPDHLLLVDLSGRDDHMGALADLLTARLRAEDVGIERFDFNGDPRHLRVVGGHNGERPNFTDLQTLRTRYPDHRLLVLSDTAIFGESANGGWRDWADDLQLWQEAAVITPLPAGQWGPRESALIHRGFAVTEATPPGLASLVRQLRENMPHERATPGGAALTALDQRLSVDPYLWLGDLPPPQRIVRGLLTDLNAALGHEGFFWLSALAVFPTMHPRLTLALGGVLADASGQSLLTEERLARLCRLPWLRRGRMPDWLRLAPVRGLQQRDAEAEQARTAWTYLLEPVREGIDDVLPIKVVRRVASGLPELVGRILRQRPAYREAILLSFINRRKLPELSVELPAQLTRVLQAGLPWMDLTVLLTGAALSGLTALMLGMASDPAAAIGAVFEKISSLTLLASPSFLIGLFGLALGLVYFYLRNLGFLAAGAAPLASAERRVHDVLRETARIARSRIGVLLSITLIAVAAVVLYRTLRDINFDEVVNAIELVEKYNLARAALLVAAGYFTLTFYDLFALRTIGRADVPYRVAALAGFTSYAVGHNVGASAFTGGAVRYRIYSAHGLSVIDVAKVCFVAGLTFWLGNAAVLGLGVVIAPQAVSAIDQLPPLANQILALAILGVLATYVARVWQTPRVVGRHNWLVTLPNGRLTLLQIGIGTVDLGCGAAAMYMLVPDEPYIGFVTLAVIFGSSTLLGFASLSPRGLGVFDAAMLVALWQFDTEDLVAGLLLFRLLYYLVPLGLSLAILGGREVWLGTQAAWRTKRQDSNYSGINSDEAPRSSS
jgi:glycosyltransferase 2 family protein